MVKEFEGRTAIVVGAGSGMGLLAARNLAAQGASVVLTDLNASAVETAAGSIGGCAWGYKCDVRDVDSIENTRDFAMEKTGRIDVLIYTAGGASQRVCKSPGPFSSRPYEVISWGIDVNLKGALFFCRAVLPIMMEQKGGVMIVTGSIDGVTGSLDSVDYSTAKSGMIGMVKSLALCGAPYNVRACCVSPGPVLTRANMAGMRTPLGRAAKPEEVVDLMLYLASDKAAFITGSNHLIDGGRACGAQEY